MDDVDPAVLMWLTDDELALRRRGLVRDYDRASRQPDPDLSQIRRIRRAIKDVHEIQSFRD